MSLLKWKFHQCFGDKLIDAVWLQNTQINGWDGFIRIENDAGVVESALACTQGCDCLQERLYLAYNF